MREQTARIVSHARPSFVLAPLLAASLTVGLHASIVEIAPGQSIQAVIDSPGTLDGDEIVLTPGVYVEMIDLRGRAVTIRSTDPTDPAVVAATVIDAGGAGTVVRCATGEGPDTVLAGLTIRGGLGMSGGGLYVEASAPTVVRCTFTDNEAVFEGGGIFCLLGDPAIVNCRVVGNRAFYGGGIAVLDASPLLASCVFAGNEAVGTGGGVDLFSGGAPRLAGCVVTANAAGDGGGLSCDDTAGTITNTIIWGNDATSGANVRRVGSVPPTFRHCDVEASGGSLAWDTGLGLDGGGNIDADPLFTDPFGPDGVAGTLDDDLRLPATAPTVDAGSNDDLPSDEADVDGDGDRAEPLPLDLDGNPRRADATDSPDTGAGDAPFVDMGPYEVAAESSCPWDLTGDGRVDGRDLVTLLKRGHDLDFVDLLGMLAAWGPCDRDEPGPRRRGKGHRGWKRQNRR